jgi:hypothetical protein
MWINGMWFDGGKEINSSWIGSVKEPMMCEVKEGPTGDNSGGFKVVKGYEPLAAVLQAALDQAQKGKGKERHANNLPFNEQPIMQEARAVGLGFTAGQARKKILEAVNCRHTHPGRAVGDLLGAINYVAATILRIEEEN